MSRLPRLRRNPAGLAGLALAGAAALAGAGILAGAPALASPGHGAPAPSAPPPAALERLVREAIEIYGRIDVLHSHAGIQVEGPLTTVDPAGMEASWQVNVAAHFHLARLVMPHMQKAGKGSIIVTASNSGVFYDHEMIAYATSKHAAVAMVKQIAIDYGKYGVRVNALCPGWVDTPFNDAFTRQMGGREALLAYVKDKIPMGRFATVEEIAESILFLASDRSSFMTGQALVVDGGECIA